MELVNLPDAKSGNFVVEKFVVDRHDFSSMLKGRTVPLGGTFTRLMRGRVVVMSDTPVEQNDHRMPVAMANGSCLINGLGIGMVLHNILLKENVTDVTVVEISQDVIDMVGPHYLKDPRVTIVHASAFDFKPPKGKRYGMVWHDIWDYICADNLPEMAKLHRKYGKCADWQDSWCKSECKRGR